MPTLEERVAKLEREFSSFRAEARELKSEIRREVSDTVMAATRHIDLVELAVREEMAPLKDLKPVLDRVSVELEGNRIERERRIAARQALEQKKLDDEKDAQIAIATSDARTRARAVRVSLAVAIIGGVVALFVAFMHH